MPSNRMSGNLLGLEIDGVFVSCEISCELTFEADLRGASPQDSGRWKEWIAGVRTWSIALNAAMLLNSTGASSGTILAAFISGARMQVRFMSKDLLISDFSLGGRVFVQNGAISTAAGSRAGWNTTLMGDGPLQVGNPNQYILQYGYSLSDPFGNEPNLVPQFAKLFNVGATSVSLDYTATSAGKYLFAIVPTGQPIFNIWYNSQFNFGAVPDFVWHPVRTFLGFDYYISWAPLYITATVPVITFSYQNLVPNAFSFPPVSNALLSTDYTSAPATITGITQLVPISISGTGTYSVNGAAYTNLPGFVGPNDVVTVKVPSSSGYATLESGIVNIGGVSASFDVTTTVAIGNDARTRAFTRQCPSGQIGSSVDYTVNANVYFSDTKAKANALRDLTFDADGQTFADDPANGGTCTVAVVRNFMLDQDARRLKLQALNLPIACDINLTVRYSIDSDPTESTRTIYLPAGSDSALNDGGSITAGPSEVINIIAFTFTPKFCSGEVVKVNGQQGEP